MRTVRLPGSFFQILIRILLVILLIGTVLLAILVVTFLVVNKTSGSLVSSGEKRTYLLYVPDSYDPQKPVPLVISIHGFAEWPAHQAQISRWNELAEQEGFIVVYPSGTRFPKRWRTMGSSSSCDPMIDVHFIEDLIDQLESEYSIDPTRIYANGLSNGGGMSVLLACELSDRIAAIGSVAGAYSYPSELCHPQRPVPLIAFHGTADPIVPYLGGPSRSFDVPFPVVPQWMKAWAARNHCTQGFEGAQTVEISSVSYTHCDQNAEVVFYTITGGGHSWPGGEPLPTWIVGETSLSINATDLMWNFFVLHPMP